MAPPAGQTLSAVNELRKEGCRRGDESGGLFGGGGGK